MTSAASADALWPPIGQGVESAPPRQILSGSDTARQAIHALALGMFLDGTQPYSRSAEIPRVREDTGATAPMAARLVRRHTSEALDICLFKGQGWTAVVTRHLKSSASAQAEVVVTAEHEDLAGAVLAELVTAFGEAPSTDCNSVPIGFWHLSERGTPTRVSRDACAPHWNEIRHNYTSAAAARIDRLTALAPPLLGGTIVLMHGPPGTGKTTALRSLARSWQDWCSFEYILDPEKLFASSGYLMKAAMPVKPRDAQWSALILEDSDDLLRSGATSSGRQSLARLLNLSDGILGQGCQTLLIITTNEELHSLHPGVIRPGRCLAEVEIGPLSHQEIRRWQGGVAADLSAPATLAQLYAHTATATSLLSPDPRDEFSGAYL